MGSRRNVAELRFSARACRIWAVQRDRVAGYRGLLRAIRDYEHANAIIAGSAGHYLPIEEPGLFSDTVRTWLAECEDRVV